MEPPGDANLMKQKEDTTTTTVSRIRILALAVTLDVTVNATAATFVVNTAADTQDALPGDGICADRGAP
jgi:hypothetical protein